MPNSIKFEYVLQVNIKMNYLAYGERPSMSM